MNAAGSLSATANGNILIQGGVGFDGLTGDYSVFSPTGLKPTSKPSDGAFDCLLQESIINF